MSKPTLIYVHDPMCSWCWGFEKVKSELFGYLSKTMNIRQMLGGLAEDSDELMSQQMQSMLMNTWLKIESTIPGTEFNHNFWRDCAPRRSTYPANRAVIAARLQGELNEQLMTHEIQKAYYTQAKNPSDLSTLYELAKGLSLDMEQFKTDINSTKVESLLTDEIIQVRKMGVSSFPSLLIEKNDQIHYIQHHYSDVNIMLQQIEQL